MSKRRAFTLIEILAMAAVAVMALSTIYKMFAGTWGQFHKSQTKLTNLRAASIMLEYLKHDLRLATTPSSDATKPQFTQSGDNTSAFKFQILNEASARKMVSYLFDGKNVTRSEEGNSLVRNINLARVKRFKIEEEGIDPKKRLKITIEADAEKAENDPADAKRSTQSQKNKVALSAVMYPRFFQKFKDQEEEFWTKARAAEGGAK